MSTSSLLVSPLSLRSALSANALFSTVCGLVLLAAPATIGTLLEYDNVLLYRLLGLGLLLFAGDLCHQATRPQLSRARAMIASIGDFVWVVATAALLAAYWQGLSVVAVALLLAVAGVVLTCGLLQARGIASELAPSS